MADPKPADRWTLGRFNRVTRLRATPSAALGLLAVVLVLSFAPTGGAIPPLAGAGPLPTHVAGMAASARSTGAIGTHLSHPIPAFSALGANRPTPSHGFVAAPLPRNNSSWCIPVPNGTVIAETGVSFILNSTPANGSGAAPLNFSWNLTVLGGGLPPYRSVLMVLGASWSVNSTRGVGNLTITTPGTYTVDLFVEDSTCTQVGGALFSIMAWGAIGPHPFNVTASANATTVPGTVTYTANNSTLPPGWWIDWSTPGLGAQGSQINHTYYLPGAYNASACFVEPNYNLYACATSPYVTVNGTPLLATGSSVPAGHDPGNVTFYANITNSSLLPANTSIYLYAWNGTSAVWAQTNNSSLTINETAGCGFPWTAVVPLSLNCTWMAIVSLLGPVNGPDHGFLGSTHILAKVRVNGTLANWFPTASFSSGPTNGSAPLNFTVNLTANGGVAPYRYYFDLFGRSSPTGNSTAFAPVAGYRLGWNGSQTQIALTLNSTGVYWFQVFAVDTANSFVTYAPALIYVGNVSHYIPGPPLTVSWAVWGGSSSPNGSSVKFMAKVTGGVAPYSIQWSFGDGTFGSSVSGAAITHRYARAGTFQPQLAVSDAQGVQILPYLQPLSVSFPGRPSVPGWSISGPLSPAAHPSAPAGISTFLVSTVVAGLLITLSGVLYRREIRRQGEALVADIEARGNGSDPSLRPRP